MANITKQLQNELKKSPKKAGLLALLLGVGLYFWAPLIWGWIGPEDSATASKPSQTKSEVTKPSPSSSTASTAKQQTKPKAASTSWRKLADWLDGDLRAAADRRLPEGRNPFAMSKTLVARLEKNKNDQKDREVSKVERQNSSLKITPGSVGLVLSSILYGRRQRIAVLNSGLYREGELIEIESDRRQSSSAKTNNSDVPDKKGQPVVVRLTKVHPRFVILTYKDKTFRMELPSDTLSGSKRIRRAKTDTARQDAES